MPTNTLQSRAGMGMGPVLLASALLHLLFLYLAFSVSFTKEKPRWTFGPIHTVELVSLASVSAVHNVQKTGGRSFMPETLARHPAISLRKPIDLTPTEPLRRIEITRKDAGQLPKISDEFRARAMAPAQPSASSALSAPAASVPARDESKKAEGKAEPSAGPTVTDAEMSALMQAYYTQIWKAIKGHWTISPLHVPKGNISATLIVKLAANGSVMESSFEDRSGNNQFDESAVRAIKKASPFPPLPEWVKGGIEIGIRFHSADLMKR